jgi:DNA-binding transcriptional MerR regulator
LKVYRAAVATYRSSPVAGRSGVPATTLRFYETAGLLPAERAASGYRVYGEAAVERLGFISSAKLLGLALEEIRDLLGEPQARPLPSPRTRPRPGTGEEAWHDAPVACTLGPAELGVRTRQWRALVSQASRREEAGDGVRLSFPPQAGLAGQLAELAAAEQHCCAFLDFTLHLTPHALQLTVRAPESAAGVLAGLFSGSADRGREDVVDKPEGDEH